MTYTRALLEVNPETFADVKARIDKIQETLPGQYEHMFHRDSAGRVQGIDMTHIEIRVDDNAVPSVGRLIADNIAHCGVLMSEPDNKDGKFPKARRLVLGFEDGQYAGNLQVLLSHMRSDALRARNGLAPKDRPYSGTITLDEWVYEEGTTEAERLMAANPNEPAMSNFMDPRAQEHVPAARNVLYYAMKNYGAHATAEAMDSENTEPLTPAETRAVEALAMLLLDIDNQGPTQE